ncbi:MAG: DegT/DnrJ/EryC1/StrS family aminotransferase [Candidatus Omnitrophica bacterium]|nr:DegT/DnrJ/EryC1/StrS family aminotransferase [Candidatus Omnitrophota bacterium]
MNIFREIPPTAGIPLEAGDFLSLLPVVKYKGSLEDDFKNYLSAPYAQVTYSGTAAFYIILESLKKLSSKKTVIIPSFICPLIPLAIKRAGLNVLVCDINKDNFDFDRAQLEKLCSKNNDLLAIIATHLAGIPVDLDFIRGMAKKEKIFVIEDCAQAQGAIYKDKKVGTIGDLSFFSLCRGKGLTIYEGGVITGKTEYAKIINQNIKDIEKGNFSSETLKIIELFGYWIFYRPLLFWLVFKAPQVFWELQGNLEKASIEYFTIDFPLHKVSSFRKKIGHFSFSRLDKEIDGQRKKAVYYIEALKDTAGIKIIRESREAQANYPFLTLIFDDPAKRNKAFKLFRNSGLGISRIYLSAITDYEYLKSITGDQEAPNARYLAERHITLSTSTFLKNSELDYIAKRIKEL